MVRSAALLCLVIVLIVSPWSFAQQAPTPTVPHLVRFAGIVTTGDGAPRAGTVGVIFSLYKDQHSGSALWTELQNVQLDASGHYTVLLGSQHPDGVPAELFTTNEARWLGIQVEADAEQPRILLVSVPYALKAGDAETLGGLPASAFVQTVTGGASGPGGATPTSPSTIVPYSINTSTSSGTAGYVARWSDASTLGNSLLFDNGTNLGIGTTSPAAALDIQTSSATPTNALNVASTLTNSSPNSGIITALNLRVTDLSTGTNVSKQTMRMSYIRDANATGGVSVFDTIFTATPIINSDAPYTLIGLNMEAPNVAAGKTLATFYGALIGAGGSSGTVTNRYALATAPGSGNVGLNTTTPIAPLNLVADNPGGAERATQFVVQGSTNPNLKLNIGLHTEASPAYADLSVVEENVAWRNLVLEKNGGNIGVGTTTPSSKLTVAGTIESTTGGIKFPDATVQATRGIPYVSGCTSGNVLGWNGSSWGCTTAGSGGGSGTVTSITAGSGITTGGSPITVSGTIAVDSTVARTNAANAFVGEQTFGGNIVGTGNLTLNGATSQLTITNGNKKFILGGFSGPAQVPNPEGGSGGSTTASGVNLVDDSKNELLITGTGNTGFGLNALQQYATLNVAYNTAMGFQTMFNESTGVQNVAVGAEALYTDVGGEQNTAVGYRALKSTTGGSGPGGKKLGSFNTAIGTYALLGNNTGSNNTGLGPSALYNITSGDSNIGIGPNAGENLVSGSNNIYIGNNIGPPSGGTESGQIRIGTPGTHMNSFIAGNVILTGTGNGIVFPDGSKQTVASAGGAAYTAGTGLTLNGSAFSVNFAGTGSGTSAARSDHNHDSAYVPLSGGTLTGPLTFASGQTFSTAQLSGTIGDTQIGSVNGSKVTGTVASAAAAVNFTGSLAGDVTGTQGATTVGKLQGVAISTTVPTNGQILSYNGSGTAWQPTSAIANSVGASGGQLLTLSQTNPAAATADRAVLKLTDAATSPGSHDYLLIGGTPATFGVTSGGTVTAVKFVGDGSGLTGLSGGGAGTWGSITGTLSNQTDLQNALNAKLNLAGGTLTGALTFAGGQTFPGTAVLGANSFTAAQTINAGGTSMTVGGGITGISASGSSKGVYASSLSGTGVHGYSESSSGSGVLGINGAVNGVAVFGEADNGAGARGLYGTSSTGYGVYGVSTAANGMAIYGEANNGLLARGVYGSSTTAYGVYGAGVTGVYGNGVTGVSGESSTGFGVRGYSSASTGVSGSSSTTNGSGVDGISNNGAGAKGVSGSSSTGYGVWGVSGATNGIGVYGEASTGSTAHGVHGYSGTGYGVYGASTATSGIGIYGEASAGGTGSRGVFGTSNNGTGVRGESTSSYGVYGLSNTGKGVFGSSTGTNGYGVYGSASTTGGAGVIGVAGDGSYGVWGYNSQSGYAGYFTGPVLVTGYLTKQGGGFKIDHPLDPANKYLNHSFVESPDMKNVYDGVATLDENGGAWVDLPEWFEALNKDFRYQLTAIGAPGPNLYIATKLAGNRFQIAGGKPGAEVSWQVTGTRQDSWANDHRVPVEEDKGADRGTYLYPQGFGEPVTKMVGTAAPANPK